MTWASFLELLIVSLGYLVFDRSAFWYLSVTYGSVSDERSKLTYGSIAFPRLMIGVSGCCVMVIAKSDEPNFLNVIGFLLAIGSVASLCWSFLREFWRNRGT